MKAILCTQLSTREPKAIQGHTIRSKLTRKTKKAFLGPSRFVRGQKIVELSN